VDPHGHLIPQKDTAISFSEAVPLLKWEPGTPAIISGVDDRDPASLSELERLNLVPRIELVVEQKNLKASLLVRIKGHSQQIRLSYELVSHLSVLPSRLRINRRRVYSAAIRKVAHKLRRYSGSDARQPSRAPGASNRFFNIAKIRTGTLGQLYPVRD